MRATVQYSHGHCKGYIRSGSSYEGPFLYELSVTIFVNRFCRKYNKTFRRGLTIPNRIALAPMQSQSALEGGYANNDTIRYYNHRSKAAGLLITEFHYVSESGGPAYMPGYPFQKGHLL
jgi:NADH-dependent oxidoreductase